MKVILLVGGASGEREVSKETCKSILLSLRELKYDVKIVDPAYGANQPDEENQFFEKDRNFTDVKKENYIHSINSELFDDVDVVFNGLHGQWGEDGIIQSLLELRGIPYTGSKVLTSSISMNKSFTKIILQHFNVPTPKWLLYKKNNLDFECLKEKIGSDIGYPCVVKPNDQGSALGLTICENESQIKEAISLSSKYALTTIIEEFIPGHEITVGVVNGHAYPPLEIKPKNKFYDYECKYTPGMSEYIVPAELPQKCLDELKNYAEIAFKALECKSYSRIDFRVNENLESYCLEINTLPGMTSTSLLPKTAKADGVSFNELVDFVLKDALE